MSHHARCLVGAGPVRNPYVQFQVSGLADGAQRALLRVAGGTTANFTGRHIVPFSCGGRQYPSMRPIHQGLDNAGAEIVLNGHDRPYERFAPQNPSRGAERPGRRALSPSGAVTVPAT